MTPRLPTPDLAGWIVALDTPSLIAARDVAFTVSLVLGALWLLGHLGYQMLRPVAPRPVAGDWRRRPSGHAACPDCAEVMIGDCLPVLPFGAGLPIEPGEKCATCPAWRAEETDHVHP